MGPTGSGHVVLDAGALIAIEQGDRPLLRTLELAQGVHIPAGALAQVWRDPRHQARLARFVETDGTLIYPLTELAAQAAGRLCALTGTSDVVDASVAVLARAVDASIVTSDPAELSRLAPGLRVIAI